MPAWARELSISLGIDELPNNLPAPLTSLVGRDHELGLGNAEHACAEDQSAAQHHHESLRLFAKLGDRRGIAASLEGLAALAHVRGQPARAVRMLGAADGLRQALGAPVSPVDRTRHEQLLAELREQLPEPQFAAGGSTAE